MPARKSRKAGRPPKFHEPSQPVTVTLPDRTINQLQAMDEDRAKAIVKAVDVAAGELEVARGIQVVEMAPGVGLLVVPPIKQLRDIPWLNLIEVAPSRYLLTITPGTPIEKVEIALRDLIASDDEMTAAESHMLHSLIAQIANLRRGQRITKSELLIVAVSTGGKAGRKPSAAR